MEGKLYTEAEVMEYANEAIKAYMNGYKRGELIGCASVLIVYGAIKIVHAYVKQKQSCKES